MKTMQQHANTVARQHGCGRANEIVLGDDNRVISHVRFGYRKITTGEYVTRAYRLRFGWKNTYYQAAKTVVMISGW